MVFWTVTARTPVSNSIVATPLMVSTCFTLRWHIIRRSKVSYTWKIGQNNLGTLCDGIYKFNMFSCEPMMLQLSIIDMYYNPLSLIHATQQLSAKGHTIWVIKGPRNRTPSTPKTILLWLEMAYVLAKRRPKQSDRINSFTFETVNFCHPGPLSEARNPEHPRSEAYHYMSFSNMNFFLELISEA